jgi:hypothetical protein
MKERHHPTVQVPVVALAVDFAIPMDPTEKVYTIKELEAFMPYKADKLRKIFRNEPGVQHGENPNYDTMGIPLSVLNTVLTRRRYNPLQTLRASLNPLPIVLAGHGNRLVPKKHGKIVKRHGLITA